MHTWFAITEWAKKLGLDEETARQLDIGLWTDPDILIQAPLLPAAYELFRKVHEFGQKPPVITTRIANLKKCTFDWFGNWMTFVEPDQIHIRDDDSENKEKFKARKIRELGVDIFFEDAVEATKVILQETEARVILVPTAGSKDVGDNPRLIKFSLEPNWPTMETIAKSLNDLEFLRSHNLIDTSAGSV